MEKRITPLNDNSYRHYNLPIVFPCMTFFGNQWVLDDNPSRMQHFHNCFELGFCQNGHGTLSIENNAFTFHAGNYSFIPENTTHRAHATHGTTSSWEYIYFDPYLLFQNILPEKALNALLSNLTSHYGIISADCERELHFLMSEIFHKLHKKEPYFQDSLKGLLLSLLMLIARNNSFRHRSVSNFEWLYSTISYIRKNYHQKLAIAEIAMNCCNLSESHFRKKFNETMHISPLDYINHLRIRIACQQIYCNEKPLNEIASDVGYPTLSSFNRNFHALFDCSPSEWRKRQTQNSEILEITSTEEEAVRMVFMP